MLVWVVEEGGVSVVLGQACRVTDLEVSVPQVLF